MDIVLYDTFILYENIKIKSFATLSTTHYMYYEMDKQKDRQVSDPTWHFTCEETICNH